MIHATAVDQLPPRPPRPTTRHGKYATFLRFAIDQPGVWFRLDPADITGANNARKQATLHASASWLGIKISVRSRPDGLYVQYAGPAQPKITVPEERFDDFDAMSEAI